MTKTALENKKLETQKELQEREQKWKSSEFKKDRRKDYVVGAMNAAGRVLSSMRKNDPNFYKRYIKDLAKFTNVPTFRRLGVPFSRGSYMSYSETSSAEVAIPGIMVCNYEDMVGPQSPTINDMALNPVNQILMRSKEQVLKSNSRSSVNWEAADLGLNIFGTAAIITFLGEYRRMILCAQTYSAHNAYLGVGLLRALGFTEVNANAFIGNLATHRKNYVILAQRFNNSIVAPADLSLYARKWYLATNVFADTTDVTKPQLYIFRNRTGFVLNDTGDKLISKGPLVTTTAEAIYNQISDMINKIVSNPDYQEMYADLRSAFGNNILQVDTSLGSDDVIVFNTDSLNREQIRNMRFLPGHFGDGFEASDFSGNANSITSDTSGYLYQGIKDTTINRVAITPNSSAPQTAEGAKKVYAFECGIDSHRQDLYNVNDLAKCDGDTILEITRFKFSGEVTRLAADSYSKINITDCGTEILVSGSIYAFTDYSGESMMEIPFSNTVLVESGSMTTYKDYTQMIALYTAFDWAPTMRVYWYDATDKFTFTFGDMANTFAISQRDVASLNQACVLSELYIESTGFKH